MNCEPGEKNCTALANPPLGESQAAAQRRKLLLRLPLTVKVTLLPVASILALGAALSWQVHHDYRDLEVREVQHQARFIARLVASGVPSFRGDVARLGNLLEAAAVSGPATGTEVVTIRLLDATDNVLVEHRSPSAGESRARQLEARVPVPDAAAGSVVVVVNDHHVDYELEWHTRHLLRTTGLTVLLAAVVGWFLMRKITRPLAELVGTVRTAKAGHFGGRVPVRSRDEIGELGIAFNELLGALELKQAENQQLRQKLFLAQEEERKRVANELHDHTGQALTSLIAGLAALKVVGPHQKEVAEMASLAARTLHEVHDISRILQPSVLSQLGLVTALRQLCEHLGKRLNMDVAFSAIGFEETTRLPVVVELAVYRIAQEAIANAARHGEARTLEVLLQRRTSGVLAVFEDNGRGFEVSGWRERCLQSDRIGLLGIEERTSLLGGSFRIESYPGGGTRLFVSIPLAEDAHAKN